MSQISGKVCNQGWSGLTVLGILGGFFFGFVKGRGEYKFAHETWWLKHNEEISMERNHYLDQIRVLTDENNQFKGITPKTQEQEKISGDFVDAFTNIDL